MNITALEAETHDGDREGWNHDTGNPTVATFAEALSVWSAAQTKPPTVNDAALSFNVTPAIIREAVEWHAWMFIADGDRIEHDGE